MDIDNTSSIVCGLRLNVGDAIPPAGLVGGVADPTVKEPTGIIALRGCLLSNRREDSWEYRACAQGEYPQTCHAPNFRSLLQRPEGRVTINS